MGKCGVSVQMCNKDRWGKLTIQTHRSVVERSEQKMCKKIHKTSCQMSKQMSNLSTENIDRKKRNRLSNSCQSCLARVRRAAVRSVRYRFGTVQSKAHNLLEGMTRKMWQKMVYKQLYIKGSTHWAVGTKNSKFYNRIRPGLGRPALP